MDNESSLLAYLVPRLTSRGEDTATDALAFILNKSEACRRALDSLLSEQGFDLEPITRFETQVTHEDGSRPDMVGYDSDGNKRLLVESKFWAALLEGQASGYFSQLEASGPGVLVFIAPGTRIETLWAEIRRQMDNGSGSAQLESIEAGDRMRSARIAGSQKRVMLVSWDRLLERLAHAAPANSQIASDIEQLRGFVHQQDLETFQPIQPGELSPWLARRVRWINHLIDDVVDARGVPEGWISVSGLRATPQRADYGRYIRFVNDSGVRAPYDCFLCVNLDYWATKGDTPLWLWIGSTTEPARQLRDSDHSLVVFEDVDGLYTPIYLKVGVEYHRVLDDAVDQLRRIAEIVVG